LTDVLDENQELIHYLQEAVGYTLTGHTSEECLFYLCGPTRGGKGIFTETLILTLGREPLATEADFGTFSRSRDSDSQNFDMAGLKECRLVVASEGEDGQPLNAPRIKHMTGGNYIRCAHKFKDFFTYRPKFKIWLSSNYRIRLDVNDDAAWGRVRVIHFPNSYLGQENKRLKQRMSQPEVLRGVLAWAVEGAKTWYSRGSHGLDVPRCVGETTHKARHELDHVARWLEARTKDVRNGFVPNECLYASYADWCDNTGLTPMSNGDLTKDLKAKGYPAGKQKWHHGANCRGCLGIALKEHGA
jgi:putative DNA primase/helicase